ncbi:hypothetical protein NRB56_01480 [Nocardia sp. RB56]|uniref:Uncharacterized protein n=1 Tax=Nocardia aurantia TaxID=2585199 RepID=A0A7K0DFN0_9NOCA|nr:hypothetical protein [Nocardia aurantia]
MSRVIHTCLLQHRYRGFGPSVRDGSVWSGERGVCGLPVWSSPFPLFTALLWLGVAG